MDKWQFTFTAVLGQDGRTPRIPLAVCDRRKLLGASLRLLGYRYDAGIAILRADLVRVAEYFADDVESEVIECLQRPLVPGVSDSSEPGP